MNNLVLLPYAHTSEERIQSQIDSFRRLFMTADYDLENCNQIIDIIISYLAQFDDDNIALNQAYVKLQESNFWLYSALDC